MEICLNKLTLNHHFGTSATIFLMFTYTILLDRDLACTCAAQQWACPLYMALPVLIIFVLTLWTSRSFLGVCRFTCTFCGSEGCGLLVASLSKVAGALSVGLLWVAFVLIDGDWYVCCRNNGSDAEQLLGCKAAERITESEHGKIQELKNTSRVLGGALLLGIILVGFLMKLLLRVRCCRKSGVCDRKFLYYRLILKEEDHILKGVLRKSAQDQLTKAIQTRIQGGRWEECFNVAEDLVRESVRPEASGGGASEEQELETLSPGVDRLQEQRSQEERAELSV